MTRVLALVAHRATAGLPGLLGRMSARGLTQGIDRLRRQVGPPLVQGRARAGAALAVARRTRVGAQVEQGWRRTSVLVRRAWAEAEGFEVEAVAGILLVLLTIVIVVHGLLT